MRRWCRWIIMMLNRIGNREGKRRKESKLTPLPKTNQSPKTQITTKVVV